MKIVKIAAAVLALMLTITGCSGNPETNLPESEISSSSLSSDDTSINFSETDTGSVSEPDGEFGNDGNTSDTYSENGNSSSDSTPESSISNNESAVQDTDSSGEYSSSGSSSVVYPDNGNSDTSSSSTVDKPKPSTSDFSFEWKGGNTWQEGGSSCGTLELVITNNSGSNVDGWKAVFTVPSGFGTTNSWGGTITVNGTSATAVNADYNSSLPAGGSVTIGFNYKCPTSFTPPKTVSFNGTTASSNSGNTGNGNNGSNNNNSNNGSNNNNNNNGNNGNNGGAATSGDVKELLERSDKAVQGDDWLYADGNKILDKDGKQVWLTGVNWFGYNTGTNTFDGLWNSELVSSVKGIADHGFNLIRVPISAELINQWAAGVYPQANYNNALNPNLNNMNSLQIFDYFLKLAEENGIKVMPDIHCAETNAMGHNVNLWYTDKVSVNDYYHALEWIAERYKNNDTIIAIDLKNEPHGKQNEDNKAIWNNSTDKNNWKYTAETAAKKILAINPNVLIMVEGTEIYPKSKSNMDYKSTNEDDYYFNWWGGNLRGVKDYPINLGKYQNKLVYSPHDYGPTVYQQPWFKGSYNYDTLIRDCWQDNWLYIHKNNTAPLLIGEWGGFMKEPNLTWMTCMRKLIKTYHLNHTFWCYNANSGDTGGLVLDDFKTWDTEKYNFVKEVLWQENGKFVGLDHAIPLGSNGITLKSAKGL